MPQSSFLLTLLISLVFVGLVLAAQSLLRRAKAQRQTVKANDVVGFYLGLIGALYGIALAFILTAAWDNQEQTRRVIDQEAQVLGTLAYYGRGLPHPFDDKIVEQTQLYAGTMVEEEWPSLAQGHQSKLLDQESARLGLAILRYTPRDARGQELSQQLLASFAQLRALRGERRLKAEYRIPTAIWALIIFGALVMLGLCFQLEVESHRLHLLQTGLIAAFLALSLAVTWDLQNPFQGFSDVDPEPFRRLSKDTFMNEELWQQLSREPTESGVRSRGSQ